MSVALFPLPPVHVMAATTALLSVSAGRRRLLTSSSSASTIVWREVSGQHKLTIDGCTPCRNKPWSWSVTSRTFEAAGYRWRITYYPNGTSWVDDDYISLYLDYDGRQQTEILAFQFSLLDRAGNPVPEFTRSKEMCIFCGEHRRKGFHDFIRWKDLEESGCLAAGNSFAVQCDITVVREWAENDGAAVPAPVVVPPSDLKEHLNNLLWKKQGTDVTIHVGGGEGEKTTTFDAHGWLLAARSPVFEAELLAAAKEKASSSGGGGVRRRMDIHGMEPKVFKAMLHFMYTDTLPEIAEHDVVAMAQGLVAAAHRYRLERLKLMCEAMLLKRIDVDTAASSLAVAELHGCRALKAACEEFIAYPGSLKAVMKTEGFQKIKANCPYVLAELALKQLA